MTARQQHLQTFQPFCSAIHESLGQVGLKSEEVMEVFRVALSAQCVQCGIYVSGAELFALSRQSLEGGDTPKIKRLRLGDCARKGCDSYYYRLSFEPIAGFDWPTLLARADSARHEPTTTISATTAVPMVAKAPLQLVISRRAWIALGVILLLLVIRQWYRGGRIPLIHEPEHFRVDPAPQEETERDGTR